MHRSAHMNSPALFTGTFQLPSIDALCPERHSPELSLPVQKDPRGCTLQIMHRKTVLSLSARLLFIGLFTGFG